MKNNKISFFEKLTGNTSARKKPVEVEHEDELNNRIIEEPQEAELAIDMYQTPTEIIIKTMVAGVKPEDLQIAITREMVTIKGTREVHNDLSDGDFFAQELYWGSFTRSVMLPQEVDSENAEAVERHGLLTIKLPKIIKERSKTLKVKSV